MIAAWGLFLTSSKGNERLQIFYRRRKLTCLSVYPEDDLICCQFASLVSSAIGGRHIEIDAF